MSTSNGSTNGASDYEADLDLLYAWMPPSTPAAPCPEATFSITLRGTLDGVETLLTARGMTAAEFTAQFAEHQRTPRSAAGRSLHRERGADQGLVRRASDTDVPQPEGRQELVQPQNA
jgi:hypothetical protein